MNSPLEREKPVARRTIEDILKNLEHLISPSVAKARGVASLASALIQTLIIMRSDRQNFKKLEQRVALLENQLAQHHSTENDS
jgi:hypothetical protein